MRCGCAGCSVLTHAATCILYLLFFKLMSILMASVARYYGKSWETAEQAALSLVGTSFIV